MTIQAFGMKWRPWTRIRPDSSGNHPKVQIAKLPPLENEPATLGVEIEPTLLNFARTHNLPILVQPHTEGYYTVYVYTGEISINQLIVQNHEYLRYNGLVFDSIPAATLSDEYIEDVI